MNNTNVEIVMPPAPNEGRDELAGIFDRKAAEPNMWFAKKFPAATKTYGGAFLEGNMAMEHGYKKCIPLHLNDICFAAILGGDKRLGHQAVYHPQEDKFYFYDYQVDAFCPTSEEKLKLVLSNFLTRCATECSHFVDISNLMVRFRKDCVLDNVILKAKALLEISPTFFVGEKGKRRLVDGKYIEPDATPAHELFVKKAIVRNPSCKLTVSAAFSRYHKFCLGNCLPPLSRAEFKDLVAEAIWNRSVGVAQVQAILPSFR